MKLSSIKRNEMDYILTDSVPVEISDNYSMINFYNYLLNNCELKEIYKEVEQIKNENKKDLFTSSVWAATPLRFSIIKGQDSKRRMALPQPVSAVELFLFIRTYEKELLSTLEKNSIFSLRFHNKNNQLFYLKKSKDTILYYDKISENIGTELIERTGSYFYVKKYRTISKFLSSDELLRLNSKYKYFIKADYKSCFDSIYTHTFSWLIGKDVNDTKNFHNNNLYAVIDRILMHINGRTSNGIVVGPEFSRMMAEILLQNIDKEVYYLLYKDDAILGIDYDVRRFVDDLFIFTNNEELSVRIYNYYEEIASKYLLSLNEQKRTISKLPISLNNWLKDAKAFSKKIEDIFFNPEQFCNNKADDNKYICRSSISENYIRNLKYQFNDIICRNKEFTDKIVSYAISTILNKLQRCLENGKKSLFNDKKSKSAIYLIDFSLYLYSFYPSYSNTQKLLQIFSYIRDGSVVFEDELKIQSVQDIFNNYSYIFNKANVHDIVNLWLFFHQTGLSIPSEQEKQIEVELIKKDDPILWASYYLYSKYNDKYNLKIRNTIVDILKNRIDDILNIKDAFGYKEFWWPIIFNKAPFLNKTEQDNINILINKIKTEMDSSSCRVKRIFIDYMLDEPLQFYNWDDCKSCTEESEGEENNRDFLREFTFKTKERTIFLKMGGLGYSGDVS